MAGLSFERFVPRPNRPSSHLWRRAQGSGLRAQGSGLGAWGMEHGAWSSGHKEPFVPQNKLRGIPTTSSGGLRAQGLGHGA